MYTKIFAIAFCCIAAFSAKAQPADTLFIHAEGMQHISLAQDMQVTLVQATAGQNAFSMNAPASEKLNVHTKGTDLSIARADATKDEVIYVFVNDIQSLTLGYNALVQTKGLLRAAEIDVYVDADAKAVLRTTGKVNGHCNAAAEVEIKRSPIVK